MVVADEELQQDVQGAGENAVRNGHQNPRQAAFEHIHGGLLVGGTKAKPRIQSLVGMAAPLPGPVLRGFF